MTNDELERVMNFIIERQERIAEQQEISATQIGALASLQTSNDERIARFERSYIAISDLLQKHDGQLVALTDGLNKLTQTVERYISARGNNGSSSSGG